MIDSSKDQQIIDKLLAHVMKNAHYFHPRVASGNEAADFIQDMYGYDLSSVLFKRTLASDDQFRSSFDATLSYFVAGNEAYSEDNGFAIKPYTKVTFDNTGIINNSCRMAVAMGNYYFTSQDGSETKVEYTFAYVKDKTGMLRIVAHQSSLPYTPPK